MSKSEGTGAFVTFVLGIGVGAVATLLFAPKSGQELRADIVANANDGMDQARDAAKQLGRRANRAVGMARDQVQDAIEAGEAAYVQAQKA